MNRCVQVEVYQGVATLTLDSPHNRNALSVQLRAELLKELQRALDQQDVRSIVLTHSGPVFCSGMDLKEANPASARSDEVSLPSLLAALWGAAKPVIARLDGPARAGGIGLLAACDVAVASQEATFSFSEVRIGVVPAVISVMVLPRMAPHRVHELFLTGEVFSAERAASMGLINDSVPPQQLDDEVRRYTDMFALAAPGALAGTKRLLRDYSTTSIHDRLAEQQRLSTAYFGSAEGREGIAAFREKRPPAWAGPQSATVDPS